jgi:hypothetical protein
LWGKQRQCRRIEPHEDRTSLAHDMFDPIGMAVAAISNHMISGGNGKLRQRIACPDSFGGSQGKGIAA